MSEDQVADGIRALTRRRPFRSFVIEFKSGDRLRVTHPEAVRRYGDLFVHFGPDFGHRIFSGDGVAQFIDPPPGTTPQ